VKNKAAQELGKKGGQKTKKKYGKKHFQTIGRLAAKVRWGKDKPKELAI
jgi:general stress protein YciG